MFDKNTIPRAQDPKIEFSYIGKLSDIEIEQQMYNLNEESLPEQYSQIEFKEEDLEFEDLKAYATQDFSSKKNKQLFVVSENEDDD